MDEMNALERQLAGVVRSAMRPPRPVDAAAIVRSATADDGGVRWPNITRFGGRAAEASAADTDADSGRVRGGIRMLTPMRAAAVVAVLALSVSLLAIQAGSPTEPTAPGASEPGESWVTVTGTLQLWYAGANRGSLTSTMSDDRLTGHISMTFNAAAEGVADEDNDALWGTVTLSNDGGDWDGQWVGFVDEDGRHHITAWYTGSGAYEGLRYIEQSTQRTQDGLFDVTGLIYEGDVPTTVIPARVDE